MSQKEILDLSVNAAGLAAALRLSPAEVLIRIRVREITAVHEHGVDEDLGRERLIFICDRRVQLLIDETGHVLECKAARLPPRNRSSVKASTQAPPPADLTTAASGGSDKPRDTVS